MQGSTGVDVLWLGCGGGGEGGAGRETSKEAVLVVQIAINLPADEIVPVVVGPEPRESLLPVDLAIVAFLLPRFSLLLRGGSKNPRSISQGLGCDPSSLACNSGARIVLPFAHN